MPTAKERRAAAFGIMTANARRWFWRLSMAMMLFGTINFAVSAVMQGLYSASGIRDCETHLEMRREAEKRGETFPEPTRGEIARMLGASAFLYMMTAIVAGAGSLGAARLRLRAVRSEEGPWFKGALDGFKDPFGMISLTLLPLLRVLFGLVFFIVPGLMLAYSYKQVWYLKAEHPEWGAHRCLAESAKMMNGHRMRLFKFELSYFFIFFMLFAAYVLFALSVNLAGRFAAVLGSAAAAPLVPYAGILFLGGVVCIALATMLASVYFTLGQALFYDELAK